MTQPEFSCPFNQEFACKVAVGALADEELAVQSAYMTPAGYETDAQAAALAEQYAEVASGAFGLEMLGEFALRLGSGRTCGEPCPVQRQITLRENMRGNPGVQPQS